MNKELKLENIDISYEDYIVLKNINITFKSSNIYILRGENGAGKTSLLKLINGDIKANYGTFTNNNVTHIASSIIDNGLFNDLTVMNNLSLITNDKDKLNNIINVTNLDNLLEQKAKDLSQGEYQIVTLAKLFLIEADCYLIDEITANFDDDNVSIFEALINTYSKDRIIILATNSNHKFNNAVTYEIKDQNLIQINGEENVVDSNIIYNNINHLTFKKLLLLIKSSLENNLISYILLSILLIITIFISSISINMKKPDEVINEIINDNNISYAYADGYDYLYQYNFNKISVEYLGNIYLTNRKEIKIDNILYNTSIPQKIKTETFNEIYLMNVEDFIENSTYYNHEITLDFINPSEHNYYALEKTPHNNAKDIIEIYLPLNYDLPINYSLENINAPNIEISNFDIKYYNKDVKFPTVSFSSAIFKEISKEFLNCSLFEQIASIDEITNFNNIKLIGDDNYFDYERYKANYNAWFYIIIGFDIFMLVAISIILYFISKNNIKYYKVIKSFDFNKNISKFLILSPLLLIIFISYMIGFILKTSLLNIINNFFKLFGAITYKKAFKINFDYLILSIIVIIILLYSILSFKKDKTNQ